MTPVEKNAGTPEDAPPVTAEETVPPVVLSPFAQLVRARRLSGAAGFRQHARPRQNNLRRRWLKRTAPDLLKREAPTPAQMTEDRVLTEDGRRYRVFSDGSRRRERGL